MASRPDPELDRRYMRGAVELAESVLGLTSPNPAVGCVLVRDGRIIARGATGTGGRPHAEAVAVALAGRSARGASAYVSLEPCAHWGQTPPCAGVLVDAGVRRVVVGCRDPFPQVRGRGIRRLRDAGLEVTVGVMEQECRRINEGFFTRVSTGRPFVLLKLAMTLDGRIAAERGDSRWISSEPSRALVHRWRRECDAVMVGAGTVIADNPRLTCRIKGGRDPVRIVIDGRLQTSPSARVFKARSSAPAMLVTTAANLARARRLHQSTGVEVIAPGARSSTISIARLMQRLGQRGWNKLMIEGGAHLAAAALAQRVVDRVAFFLAPRLLGCGMPALEGLHCTRVRQSIRLADASVRRVGDDWLVEARPVEA